MDALVKTAIESLVKKILPLLEQQLTGVLHQPGERPTAELAYLINESRELLDLMSSWTASHHGKSIPKAPPTNLETEPGDDEALALMAEMDDSPKPVAKDQVEEELSEDEAFALMAEMDDSPKPTAKNQPEKELSEDEAFALMAEMDDSPKPAAKTHPEKELSEDEAFALMAEMDDSPKPASKAQPAEEISDDEAAALLAEMDGTPASSSASEEELSDDEAAALLAEMEAPPKKPNLKASSAAPARPMGDDEAARLLAEMEDEPAAPAAAPSAKASTPAAQDHDTDDDCQEIPEWEANDFQSDPSMLNDFITNSDELMQTVDDAILRLEQDPTNKAIIEEIFRAAHTLKGGSGMFGFKGIERVMHRMENLFDLIRKDKLVPTPETIDVVFQGIDLLRRLLQAVKDGAPCGVKTAPVVRALSYAAKGKTVPKTNAPAPAPAPTPAAAAAPAPIPAAPKPAAAGASGHDDERKDARNAKKTEQSTIRVDLERLDVLVNLVGELVIDRTRFASIEEDLRTNFPQIKLGSSFSETVQLFGRHMNEIQDIIMKVRMVPIGNAFNKFTRVIRDLSRSLNKKIDLIITGEAAELDKTLVEQIGDPLIHLIRNACDHGIEMPEVRKASGKNPTGKIYLSAHQEGNQIVIKIEDDGKGMDAAVIRRKAIEKGLISEETQLSDRDCLNLIFEAGFSTADQVTNISGRGVGMDVVKKQIMKLKGMLELDSAPGRGTTVTIRLPLTLAIVQSLLVRSRGETFAIPLNSVIESIRIAPKDIQKVGEAEVFKLRETVLPLIHLDEVMSLNSKEGSISDLLKNKDNRRRNRIKHDRLFVVVVGQPDRPTGIVVDQLLNQQEMVIKSMGPLMRNIPCVAGGAVLGHGEVVLVLDIPELEAASRRGRMQAA
jgi:two-component system chemotaxis sensor kinase CheA